MEYYGFTTANWFSFPKLYANCSELRFKYLQREQIPIFKDDERDLELSDKISERWEVEVEQLLYFTDIF